MDKKSNANANANANAGKFAAVDDRVIGDSHAHCGSDRGAASAHGRKQRIAMIMIVVVGLIASAAVIVSGRGHVADANGAEHEEHAEAVGAERGGTASDSNSISNGDGNANSTRNAGQTRRADSADKHGLALTADQINAAGIRTQTAGPGHLRADVQFQGEIRFDEDRTAHVVPRFAGVAESVPTALGQHVKQGQVLAVVTSTALSDQRSELLTARKRRDLAKATYEREKQLWEEKISARQDYQQAEAAYQEADIAVANAMQKLAATGAAPSGRDTSSRGLNRFEIKAPFAGTVVEKHLSLGEAVKEDATIFTVSDLSSVWAEFNIAPRDLPAVRVGQKVVVSSTAFEGTAEGTVSYIGALLGEQTRSARARVTLRNPQGAWRPGLFVTVAVQGEDVNVPLAVKADALQTIDGQPTLFVRTPEGFSARAVRTGRSDGRQVELTGGLQPGERYAESNTFVLRSELGKSSAEHGH